MHICIILLLAVGLSAINIDVFGDYDEIDRETVNEAREHLLGRCVGNVKISGLDYYDSMRILNPENFKIALENQPCVLDDTYNRRAMMCETGNLTGSTITYVKESVCDLKGEIRNIIASHIPTQKLNKLHKFLIHLGTAIDVYKKVCPTNLRPRCKYETDGLGRVSGRTETPYVDRKGYAGRQNLRNRVSDVRNGNRLRDSGHHDFSDTTPTTTMTTPMMESNDTEYFYDSLSINENNHDSDGNEMDNDNDSRGQGTEDDVYEKVQRMADNLQEFATNLAQSDDEISADEIVTLVCISLACLLIIVNIMIHCMKNRSNSIAHLRADIIEMRDHNETLQQRLWSSPVARRNV